MLPQRTTREPTSASKSWRSRVLVIGEIIGSISRVTVHHPEVGCFGIVGMLAEAAN